MKKSRRDFIRISALGLGGVAAGLSALRFGGKSTLFAQDQVSEDGQQFSRYPTYCEVCFWKCAGWTYTDSTGKITKVLGNDADPHCNGRLCPRGTGGIGMYFDDDRLKRPLIRVEGKKGQTFREASWEEALDLVASKFRKIAEVHGPESIALFNHGSPGEHFGQLLKAMGSVNIAAPSFAQCRGPREVAFMATYGTSLGSPEPTDIRDTRCLVLLGSHLGENMHNGQVQEMSDAIDKGATIITVDPRFSTVASKSKHWLPIRPSTDLALLLAWIHVVIYEERYDKKYVEKYTYGLDALREHVRNTTPEWAYGITSIEPATIRETARVMADAAPATIVHPGRHVTWYGDDTQRLRAVAILNALLGSWGRRGGFYFKESFSLPEFPHPPFPKPQWTWKDKLNGRYPLAALAVSNVMVEASIPEKQEDDKAIRAWIVAGTNLPLAMPEKQNLMEAMQALDFMVVVDTMPMEITGYADVVLPECTYLERYDEIRTSPHREPYIALRMPAAEPRWESKPAWWIAQQIGQRLGLGDYFNYKEYSEALDWQLKQVGSSLKEMQQIGVKKFPRKSGKLYLAEGEDFHFNTPTGKIELFSLTMQEAGADPLPSYVAHPQPPAGFYRLIYGRAPMHTFGRTANNPHLTDLMPENNVWLHPRTAKLWEIRNGQEVWLKNQDGIVTSFPVKVRVTERIRWDSVYIVHGFGHNNPLLSRAFGKGANDSELITNVMVDPVMGGTGMRGNFVTFLTTAPGKELDV